jgi:hypothetical protein
MRVLGKKLVSIEGIHGEIDVLLSDIRKVAIALTPTR